MPLARHDRCHTERPFADVVSTHMPLARHDFLRPLSLRLNIVSTHMPLARHDISSPFCLKKLQFLLTCLLRGMTAICDQSPSALQFLLTCLLRGMTECLPPDILAQLGVSTHMPLARHDGINLTTCHNDGVSTHMPLARHDAHRHRFQTR